ncbi:MAG: bifunctional pyr operon transcriptional regulator/uracil phosphoribosyltransferase PyrR [Erysipelotrichaceae bacterium]|nr:bifunctional pyr operon transcriptional regulator/uracil phosphoribosyltransferase PyrR [Erysipelotrichaceae bacterium]
MKELIDKTGMSRSLIRIAHEIIEKNKGVNDLVLVGIKTRGIYIAKRLSDYIEEFEHIRVPYDFIDISFWRDDISEQAITKHKLEIDVKDKTVILVDDVLSSGRTVRAAMDGILDSGRASSIQLAVLVDRGHRELPIRADYVGKNIPTSTKENIVVKLEECDDGEGIYIEKKV